MNTKKMLAGVCAGAMALSLTVPAFAAGTAISNGTAVNFTGKPAEGEIAVVMQTGKSNLYVNPYGLPWALGYGEVFVSGGDTFDKTKDLAVEEPSTATEGFFSDTAVIQNNGDIDLDVSVSMTTTEKGDLVFVANSTKVPGSGTITKQVMYGELEIATAELTTGKAKVTTAAAVTGSDPKPAVKTEVDGVQIVIPDWENKETVAIPAGAAGADASPLTATAGKGAASAAADTGVVLAAAETTTDSFGTSTTTPGYVAYRLTGTAVPADKEVSPATAPAAWTDADVADVTVAFTFAPHVDTPAGP